MIINYDFSFSLKLLNEIKDRWTHAVQPISAGIKKLVQGVVDLLPEKLRSELMSYIDGHAMEICNAFPQPYGDEIM